jgi:hypothetical protein
MSMPKSRRQSACRPESEALETRELLSKTLQGVDTDGDTWVLKLFGPGDVSVVNQNGADGQPVPLGQPALIKSISMAGASPSSTRLVGSVKKGTNGDGRVFFSSLSESASARITSNVGVGTLAVDIPGFWLGSTNPSTNTDAVQGTIDFPDGIVTLRFGGIDTTFNGLATNNRSDSFNVELGLPTRIGTSIIVDQIITSNQAAVGTGQPTQDTANIHVNGRINLFQANSIAGDETLDLGDTQRYDGTNTGGTTISSGPAGTNFLGTVLGFIGRFRVGGNATNLSVAVNPTTNTKSAITNFSIGGETNKISVDADSTLRTAQFGLGMDTVFLTADRIQYLGANRGAVGSEVITRRDGGLMNFGGDVSNTQVLVGYSGGPTNFIAQELGRLTVLVAGDVTDSVFGSSYQPNEDNVFGTSTDLKLTGMLDAKVEGAIDNSQNPEVSADASDQAFFAKSLKVVQGPITPPAAPGAPYQPIAGPGRTPGVRGVSGGAKEPAFRFVKRLANRG